MRFRFQIGSVLGFFILVQLLHEIHELAHHLCVRLVCGCWGTRDFMIWKLCTDCSSDHASIVAGFAGPFITFLFMWTGFILLRDSNPVTKRSVGFALVAAALPLPRILGAADGGGDEIHTMRLIFEGKEIFKSAPVITGGLIVLLLSLPPLWRAFRSVRRKERLLTFSAFLVIPWVTDELVVTRLLQGSLAPSGFLMQPLYVGIPLLVIIWETLLMTGFLFTGRKLKFLMIKEPDKINV